MEIDEGVDIDEASREFWRILSKNHSHLFPAMNK